MALQTKETAFPRRGERKRGRGRGERKREGGERQGQTVVNSHVNCKP